MASQQAPARTATDKRMISTLAAARRAALPLAGKDLACLAALVLAWTVAAVVANPVGDFPLNDDWAYGASVKTLVEQGDFRLSDWTATNLAAQVLWGALFCLPFGFSFTALRLSTLVLSLAGILACYALLREVRAGRAMALLGADPHALRPCGAPSQ